MKISVIVPCFNCEKCVEETLDSIVNQTYKNIEIIAIDDCSMDNTYKILNLYSEKDKRLKVFKNKTNMGVALTRNKGVGLSNSNYIAFIDADDVWEEEKLSIQIKYINHENIDAVATSYDLYNADLSHKINSYHTKEIINYKKMLCENLIGLSTVLIKKDVYEKFRMTNKYIHEDYELWLKLLRNNYKIRGIDKQLVKYRLLESSRNFSKLNSLKGRARILYYEERINPICIFIYILIYGLKGLFKYRNRINLKGD
ncbi:MAG: glycosyltransferase family 2 protein [Lachnospirales bacterium]